jgi:hypothetical protein
MPNAGRTPWTIDGAQVMGTLFRAIARVRATELGKSAGGAFESTAGGPRLVLRGYAASSSPWLRRRRTQPLAVWRGTP